MTDGNKPINTIPGGLTKRELFAAMAMQAIVSNPTCFQEINNKADAVAAETSTNAGDGACWITGSMATELADALIGALNQEAKMIYDHHNDGYAKEYEAATPNIFDDGYYKNFQSVMPEPKRIYEPVPKFIGPFKIRNRDCAWARYDQMPCFKCVECAKEFYD
jgi:hypothetical protein